MKKGKALDALNNLYKYGYRIIQENNHSVEGFFISDSGILFTRDSENLSSSFNYLLQAIRKINLEMLNKGFLLTTSIAYGHFRYQDKIDFNGIEKNPIYGEAYISAFLDNEKDKPKIKPGECRVVRKNLPRDLKDKIDSQIESYDIFRLLKPRKSHYYFYWMLNNSDDIDSFSREYIKAYDSRYLEIKNLLKNKTDFI